MILNIAPDSFASQPVGIDLAMACTPPTRGRAQAVRRGSIWNMPGAHEATVRALHRQPTLDAAPRMTDGPLIRIFTQDTVLGLPAWLLQHDNIRRSPVSWHRP